MFENLNPLDKPTAIIEIAILLLGAFLIGLIFAALFFRARKKKNPEANTEDTVTKSGISRKEYIRLQKAENEWVRTQSTLENQIRQLQADLKAAEAKIPSEKNSPEKESKKNAEQNEILLKEKQSLQDKLTHAKQEVSNLKNALENAKKAGSNQTKMVEEIEELKKNRKKDQELIGQLKEEKSNLEKKLSELEKAKQAGSNQTQIVEELEELKKNRKKDQELIGQLKEEKSNLEKKLSELEKSALKKGEEKEALDKLNAQLKAQELQSEKLGEEIKQKEEALSSLKSRLEKAEFELDKATRKISSLEKELAEGKGNSEGNSLNTRIISKLTLERDQLKKELEQLQQSGNPVPGTGDSSEKAPKQDDLTKIKGITPEISKSLAALGFSTYQQLAGIKKEDRPRIEKSLQLKPGTIQDLKWSKKAKKLADS